jgi:hypothetical protein
MLKKLEDFDPFNYHGYFLVESDQDITVKFFTSNGYIEFKEYDTYVFDGFCILAFYEIQANLWIKDFQISYDNKSLIYQNEFYEKFKDILNGDNQMERQVYLFMNSKEVKAIESFENIAIPPEDRCDFNKFGPASFYPKVSNTSAKITDIKLPMSVTGIGHIFRGEVESWENAYSDKSVDRQKYTNSRTFSGCLKVIYEWSLMTQEPWNNTEDIAIKASQFLTALNLNEKDLKETTDAQCDMRIAKYLKGEHEHSPLPENHFISNGLKDYFRTYYKYFCLKTIKENHPKGNQIPQSFLDAEAAIYEEMVSYYCMLNGVDRSDTTLKELYEHVGSKSHYTEEYPFEDYNNLVIDVIQKMLGNEFYNEPTI